VRYLRVLAPLLVGVVHGDARESDEPLVPPLQVVFRGDSSLVFCGYSYWDVCGWLEALQSS
jgi:hypothetical protein